MVAIPIGEIADEKIATWTCVVGYPGVFISIGNIIQDRIAVARVESNSACISLPLLGIGERDVVADQVIVGTIDKLNTVRAVVIGGIPADRGSGGAVDVDARTGGTRHRAAGVADMVVRDGDVVRAEHVNATVSCTGISEAINGDITFR